MRTNTSSMCCAGFTAREPKVTVHRRCYPLADSVTTSGRTCHDMRALCKCAKSRVQGLHLVAVSTAPLQLWRLPLLVPNVAGMLLWRSMLHNVNALSWPVGSSLAFKVLHVPILPQVAKHAAQRVQGLHLVAVSTAPLQLWRLPFLVPNVAGMMLWRSMLHNFKALS